MDALVSNTFKMKIQIPVLVSFETDLLDFEYDKTHLKTFESDVQLMVNRVIAIKEGKTEKNKFLIKITILASTVDDQAKRSKKLEPTFSISCSAHFSHNEEISDFSPQNSLIRISTAQAYVLTNSLFKECLTKIGMDTSYMPVGIDFDI